MKQTTIQSLIYILVATFIICIYLISLEGCKSHKKPKYSYDSNMCKR
jgi:hypothetical protein